MLDLPERWKTANCRLAARRPSRLNATASPRTHDNDSSVDLISWASERGAEAPKVGSASFKGVRGLRVKETIRKGEPFMYIPRKLALVTAPGRICPFPQWIDRNYFKSAHWSMRLALLLLQEKREGKMSMFYGYVEQLPASVDLPYFWTSHERAWLACPFLQSKLQAQLKEWREWYSQLMAACPHCDVSRADLDWALACVYSRSFSGPYVASTLQDRLNALLLISGATALCLTAGVAAEERVLSAALSAVLFNFLFDLLLSRGQTQHSLCPVIDSANHSSKMESEVCYSYFRDGYEVVAPCTIPAGEEALISYGTQTSDSLMQYYGFVEPDNVNDLYTFADFWTLLRATGTATISVNRLNEVCGGGSNGACPMAESFVSINSKAQVRDEVKTILRYVLGLADSLQAGAEKVSNALDVALWHAVRAVALAERQRLGGSAKEDDATAKQARAQGQGRKQVAFAYAATKKRFLDARLAQLDRRIEQMMLGD